MHSAVAMALVYLIDQDTPKNGGTFVGTSRGVRVVHGRAHIFDVTMGGKYVVDGHRIVRDAMEAESLGDDFGKQGVFWAPIPETIAADLRLHLEADRP